VAPSSASRRSFACISYSLTYVIVPAWATPIANATAANDRGNLGMFGNLISSETMLSRVCFQCYADYVSTNIALRSVTG
jgi:hypothetical protein